MAALLSVLIAAGDARAVTTFTVNATGDQADADLGDPVCDVILGVQGSQCTLRAAIQEANATANAGGPDRIEFSISGSGPHAIKPTSQLPEITQSVTIDGYTQGDATTSIRDDARQNTLTSGTNAVLKIELDGSNPASGAGLKITASNTTVRGLVINRFAVGVNLADTPGTTGNKLEGCFLGTDPSGTQDLGNSTDGVFILGTNTTVGGTTRAARNLISGNNDHGVSLSSAATGTKVQGNLIGTQADGTSDLGNDNNGMFIQGSQHTVGGDSGSLANTIAFNGKDGFGDGVRVFSGTANRILQNSIFSNVALGIDLGGNGPTPNDPRDPDTGPNNLQNKPVLTSALTSGGSTTIEGRLNSTPNKAFTIQFFSNPSGNEGKTFIGQRSVTTNANGNTGTFTFSPAQTVAVGETVTATATRADGTSEFSAPRVVAVG